MFREFFLFELKFRFKSPSTYIYFFIWLAFSFLCVASESFGPVSNQNGKLLLNGPYANTLNDIYSCLFGVIVIAAIFGTSVLRDFQRDTTQILFTKPISRTGYLGGRWAGSMVTTLLVFSGLLLGTWLGTHAPWADHARIGPNHLWWYLQPFLTIVVTQVFVLGTLFFAISALTRSLFVVYLQGVVLFIVYLVGLTAYFATRSLEHFWSGILDPVGVLLDNSITRYWSVIEQNTKLLPWDFSGYSPGVLLYNRLLWVGIAVLALAALWALFPLSVEKLTVRSQGKRAARARQLEEQEQRGRRSFVTVMLPKVHTATGAGVAFAQFRTLASLRMRTILREVPFWAIVIVLLAFAINNASFAGRMNGSDVWPVTYLMLQAVEGSATLFFYIVAALFAAELVWRERDVRFDGIHDALPMGGAIDWLSKLAAITMVEVVLLVVTLLVGVTMQALMGYYHFELSQYVQELFFITLPQLVAFAMFAMFVQTLVPNKFIGHGIVIGLFVLQPVLYNFGIENTLYLVGAVPAYTYSDMNGYGHFVPALAWGIGYWSSLFALLGVLSIAFTRRGPDVSWGSRLRVARQRLPALAPVALLCLAGAVGSGGWFYYNAHVLNEFRTAADGRKLQAAYERGFKKYENFPQPKVTAVDASIDIDPAHRGFSGSGSYTLQNRTPGPIAQVHISDGQESVRTVSFDRPFRQVSRAPHGMYTIYELEQPLQPGESLQMSFTVGRDSPGFRDGHELAQLAHNGTFFDIGFFPGIGYQADGELDDPRRRREEGLGPLADMAPRGDPVMSRVNLFSPQSDWITFHTVVSTSEDQIAIAPGYLQREWHDKGRHYFEYSMGATKIADFFAYLSGRYAVRKQVHETPAGPVSLEVYYDPAHAFNVDAMLATAGDGLDYFGKSFAPYQFSQFRIMEFPRYRSFAQSFSNTVPFSESIGFITRLKKPTDVDLTYFVTAHELAHQWWAHQLIGGRVAGSNMMSETLAQYSAYMLMQHHYGKDYMRLVLRHYLDRYLRGRAGEVRHERPLALVEREDYVWYSKGGQVMYTLADYVGEERINQALHDFLVQHRYANADSTLDVPYPDTRDLVAALRAQTPAEYQYLIDDGFDRIVLYDNKAVSASSHKRADGKYEVSIEVQARKTQVDGEGAESAMPLADYIEIGVFKGSKDEPKPLFLEKRKLTQEHETFNIVVDEMPTRAGIDPLNKLIDRIPEDNQTEVVAR
jgi:ABC-type transport system involved in multi-copper enzyme maturation permease subunit